SPPSPKSAPDACPRRLPAHLPPGAAGGWREHPPCRLSESRTWALPPFRRCPIYDMRRRDESEPPKRRFEKRKNPQSGRNRDRAMHGAAGDRNGSLRSLFHKPQGGHTGDDPQDTQDPQGVLRFFKEDHTHHRPPDGADPRPHGIRGGEGNGFHRLKEQLKADEKSADQDQVVGPIILNGNAFNSDHADHFK